MDALEDKEARKQLDGFRWIKGHYLWPDFIEVEGEPIEEKCKYTTCHFHMPNGYVALNCSFNEQSVCEKCTAPLVKVPAIEEIWNNLSINPRTTINKIKMIKEIKSWFTDNKGSNTRTFNMSIELMQVGVEYELIERIQREIVIKVAEKFIETHGEEITRDLLNNPNFADAVYNAIVLKKAEKI